MRRQSISKSGQRAVNLKARGLTLDFQSISVILTDLRPLLDIVCLFLALFACLYAIYGLRATSI